MNPRRVSDAFIHESATFDLLFIDSLMFFTFSLANLFACINSSANFLIYMLRGKKFRDAFLSTYWRSKQSIPGGQSNSFALKRLERGGTFTNCNETSHPHI